MAWFMCSMEFFTCILPVAVIAVGGALIMNGEMNYIAYRRYWTRCRR